ncbi:MAG TPA: hypothetical protein PKV16_07615 [Caldisericia bacterium]|nr:hypothetical protein [Caldisericia bacterium]HPQ93635.1 hypothetical protein [Caldisericia bacterium]
MATKGVWHHSNVEQYIFQIKEIAGYAKDLINHPKHAHLSERFNYDVILFSDLILISLQSKKEKEQERVLPYIVSLSIIISDILAYSFVRGVFFRGAISQGAYLIENNVLVGPAVDDAAGYYEKADWLGVISTPTASMAIDSLIMTNNDLQGFFLRHTIPMRDGDKCNLYAIDWIKPLYVYAKELKILSEHNVPIKAYILQRLTKKPIPNTAQMKYKNTEDFIDMCICEIRNHEEDEDLHKYLITDIQNN